MSDQTTWTSETIHAELRTILAETRGVEESECELEATLFTDLGLESIDFLEISFRFEESFGFPFPTDALGEILNSLDEDSTSEDALRALGVLHERFFMDVPEDLPGVEPFNAQTLEDAVRDLFTVGPLVTFVERRLSERAA